MLAPELLDRLCRLEQLALERTKTAELKRGVCFPGRSSLGENRFIELWTAPALTDSEADELYRRLAEGKIVDLGNDGADKTRDWIPDELALMVALHGYLRLYPVIGMPCVHQLLKQYIFDSAGRLLEKYGWQIGEPDCSAVRPLREWAPEDCSMIIDLIDPEPHSPALAPKASTRAVP